MDTTLSMARIARTPFGMLPGANPVGAGWRHSVIQMAPDCNRTGSGGGSRTGVRKERGSDNGNGDKEED